MHIIAEGLRQSAATFAVAVVLHAALCVLIVRGGGWRRLAQALVLAVAGYALVQRAPVDAITPLREGFTSVRLEAVAGQAMHAGPLWRAFWRPVLFGGDTTLRGLAGCAMAAVAASWVPWSLVLRRIGLPVGWAVALLLVMALRPVGRAAALSEIEAPWLQLYLGGAALAFVEARRGTDGARAALAMCAALAGLVRVEAALPGVVAFLCVGRSDARWVGWLDGGGLRRWAPVGIVALLLGRVLPDPAAALAPLGQAGWAVLAVDPWLWRWPTVLGWLLSVLPAGVVALAAVGIGLSLRRPMATGMVGPSLLYLYQLSTLAAHAGTRSNPQPVAGWEVIRYGEGLMPLVIACAALALARAPRTAWPALALALLIGPVPAAIEAIGVAPGTADGIPAWGRVDQDPQREARALLAQIEAEPTCAVLTRTERWGGIDRARGTRWIALVPDGWMWRVVYPDLPDLPDAAAVTAALGPCVRAWRSVDCAQPGAGCGAFDGWTPRAVEEGPARPWLHPDHGQAPVAARILGWYDPR